MSSIEWINPASDLLKLNPEELIFGLSEKLKGRCDQAFIFGSFATGEFHSESDIDIVIVKVTSLPFTQRPLEFTDLFDVFPRLDILVYTAAEFQRMRAEKDGFFSSVTNFRQIVGN